MRPRGYTTPMAAGLRMTYKVERCSPMTERPKHSLLGASGAERWMACPGSVALLQELSLPETDEPDYTREGTALHEAAEHCLRTDADTWEIVGQTFHETVIDEPMALAVQMYLDHVRPLALASSAFHIEFPVSSPVHELFYGTLDFAAEHPDSLDIVDLKGGKGIIVDPDDNPQEKYYAFGLIDKHPEWPDTMEVRLHIVQPRGFSTLGPVRTWSTTVGEIREWVHDTLVPAMFRIEYDNTLDPGPWCRFCPAKLVCPMLTSLFGAASKADPGAIVNLNDQSLGRSYQYLQAVEFYIKAMKDETLRRGLSGHAPPGTKIVNKKANRVWSPGAADLAKAKFGEKALTTAEVKGPAAIEKLPGGAEFVREHAHTPQTGYTVALESDPREAVIVQTASEAFGNIAKAIQEIE